MASSCPSTAVGWTRGCFPWPARRGPRDADEAYWRSTGHAGGRSRRTCVQVKRGRMKVITDDLQFPEGPVCLPDGNFLVVEIRRGTLTHITPAGKKTYVANLGGGPNGAAIGPDGHAYGWNCGGFNWGAG